jgi:hypothetical protein
MAGCPVEGLVYLLIEADTRILGIIHLPEAPYLDAGIMRPDQDPGTYVALPSNRDDTGLLAGSR